MSPRGSTIALVAGALVLLAASAYAGTKLRGWVTHVDERAQTITVDGVSVPLNGVAVSGGPLAPGVFVTADRGRVKVKPQRPPADDLVVRFPARAADNPGRVEFSHLRHFNGLGEKRCTTCHSAEMKLLGGSSSPAPARVSAAVEPHGAVSKGRFCATCHNGERTARLDAPVFTTAKTGNAESCARCHAPADHGRDITARHGDLAEDGRGAACASCHRQDWTARDRRLQADLLAAERVRAANPDDGQAALAVGPNNFCVHCHRADAEWR